MSDTTTVTVWHYDESTSERRALTDVAECRALRNAPAVTWVSVRGLGDAEALQRLGECFGLHPLVMEDILNTDQRPKMDEVGDYLYVVAKAFHYDEPQDEIHMEQISLVLFANLVITFEQADSTILNVVRARLESDRGQIRKRGADDLGYAVMDAVVDSYFTVLERLGEQIETVEEQLVSDPAPANVRMVHRLRQEVMLLRRSIWPLREVMSALERGETSLIDEATGIYLRDVYDHTIQIIETIETYRDMLSGMLDIYLSSVSNRMNEVMKILTIIATVFMPLTFLAGVYGMNFTHMPELDQPWTYPALWGLMIGIAGGMMYYFRRRKWL